MADRVMERELLAAFIRESSLQGGAPIGKGLLHLLPWPPLYRPVASLHLFFLLNMSRKIKSHPYREQVAVAKFMEYFLQNQKEGFVRSLYRVLPDGILLISVSFLNSHSIILSPSLS